MSCHHHHGTSERNRYLKLAPISLLTAGVEVAIGLVTGSLALVTDAIHTLFDFVENLLNAFVADRARMLRNPQMLRKFGFLGSLTLIGASTAFMAHEAILRLSENEQSALSGWAVTVAFFSLAMNLWQLQIHFGAPDEHRNITHWGQSLHILTDIGGSIAALVGTGLAYLWGIGHADAWATLGIVGLIWSRMLYGAFQVFSRRHSSTPWTCHHR